MNYSFEIGFKYSFTVDLHLSQRDPWYDNPKVDVYFLIFRENPNEKQFEQKKWWRRNIEALSLSVCLLLSLSLSLSLSLCKLVNLSFSGLHSQKKTPLSHNFLCLTVPNRNNTSQSLSFSLLSPFKLNLPFQDYPHGESFIHVASDCRRMWWLKTVHLNIILQKGYHLRWKFLPPLEPVHLRVETDVGSVTPFSEGKNETPQVEITAQVTSKTWYYFQVQYLIPRTSVTPRGTDIGPMTDWTRTKLHYPNGHTVKRLGNIFPTLCPTLCQSQPSHLLNWAIFCPVMLVNVSTLLHTCIIVSYFVQNVGKDMTLQLPKYGSPLVWKILTSCWAKYETIMHVLTFTNTTGQNISQ